MKQKFILAKYISFALSKENFVFLKKYFGYSSAMWQIEKFYCTEKMRLKIGKKAALYIGIVSASATGIT